MKSFILKYGLVLLLFISLALHIFHRMHGLSAWKGGGFGMYSTYHPTDVIIYFDDSLYSFKKNIALDATIRMFLFYPNKKNKQKLIQAVNDSTQLKVISIYAVETNSNRQIVKKLQHEIKVK